MKNLVALGCVLGFAGLASAANIHLSASFIGAFDANGDQVMSITDTQQNQAQAYQYGFDLTVTVTGLAADQDVMYTQYQMTLPTGVTVGSFGWSEGSFSNVSYSKTPTGTATAAPFFLNVFNPASLSFAQDVNVPSNAKYYGSLAKNFQYGENGGTTIGTLFLEWDGQTYGQTDWNFFANPGYLKIVSNNATGTATIASSSYPVTYTGSGDVITFGEIPEPASMSLLALGGLALLRRARRA